MNKQAAKDALSLILAIHHRDCTAVDTVIDDMTSEERAGIAASLACFATVWAELFVESIDGDVERFIHAYMAEIQ